MRCSTFSLCSRAASIAVFCSLGVLLPGCRDGSGTQLETGPGLVARSGTGAALQLSVPQTVETSVPFEIAVELQAGSGSVAAYGLQIRYPAGLLRYHSVISPADGPLAGPAVVNARRDSEGVIELFHAGNGVGARSEEHRTLHVLFDALGAPGNSGPLLVGAAPGGGVVEGSSFRVAQPEAKAEIVRVIGEVAR